MPASADARVLDPDLRSGRREEGRLSEEVAPAHRTLWEAAWRNPILLLALTALIWAAHSVIGRLAVGQIGPMTLTCARWALAIGPIVWTARGTLRRDLEILRPRWLFVGAMGALGFTGFNALFYAAAHSTGALNMSIIQGAIPALVLIGARFAFGVRITATQALGTLATMIGVATIAARGEWSRLATFAFNPGDLLLLLACVFYAFYTLGLRTRPAVSGLGFLAAMAFAALLTSIPLFIIEIARGEFIWPTPLGLLLLVFAALGPAFLAQVLYMRGVQLIGPGRAGVFVNLVPLFGALMAILLLGEPFAEYHLFALALVVGGIAVAQRAPAGTGPRG
jgi:drug/metabolite transporter (DMT)-like permease